MTNLEKMAYDWITAKPDKVDVGSDFYCQTRDIFQARYEKMIREIISIKGEDAYIVSAIVGEIGNNSFDHNVGNWRDIPGIFFGYSFFDNSSEIFIADRGQGILKTLMRVKPELENDMEALSTAFTEKISGRAPENRGNGLKFVRKNIEKNKIHLIFLSGNAKADLNEKMIIVKTENNIRGCLAIIKM